VHWPWTAIAQGPALPQPMASTAVRARVRTVDFAGGRADGGMMDQERPRVVLLGPSDGDAMVLTMGPHRAHITRKAARAETGGHWAVGEAWQDPGFDNPPHTHDEAEAFYVLEGSYNFYTDADSVEEVGPGTFVFIPPGAVHGFRTGPHGGKLICFWPSTVEAAFFNDRTDGGSR
jgi:quercetin dioxygenase-like cupin family protein